jgi:hexosaminidase
MEHTFAYSGHEEVWKDASPFTHEEIRELHKYCKVSFFYLFSSLSSCLPLSPSLSPHLSSFSCLILQQDHHIELVPNQNSFGHMHRWLICEKYK